MITKYSEESKDFFKRVYEIVREIPPGRVTSYGAIAKCIGTGKSSRMVGWAMHASHQMMDVPAHRVVNRIGLLTGAAHFEYPNQMKELLEAEGLKVDKNQVQDFKIHFWDPLIELGFD